jgi:hypothetical protein
MSHGPSDRARQLARELELRFAHDAELAWKLNDAHDRLQRANDRLWCGIHPDGIAAVYGEPPSARNAAFAENSSEVLGAPDQLQALQRIHWQIHKAHCDFQRVAEDRRRLAAEIGEIIRTFLDELMAAGWSEPEAREADIGGLAGSRDVGIAAPDHGCRNEMPAASGDREQGSEEARWRSS